MINKKLLHDKKYIALFITSIALLLSLFIGSAKLLTLVMIAWVITVVINVIKSKDLKYCVDVTLVNKNTPYGKIKNKVVKYIVSPLVIIGIAFVVIDLCIMLKMAF